MESLNWCFIKSPLEQNIIENFLGDGHCDDALNIPECDYDLGDCCLNTLNRDGFGQYVFGFLDFGQPWPSLDKAGHFSPKMAKWPKAGPVLEKIARNHP